MTWGGEGLAMTWEILRQRLRMTGAEAQDDRGRSKRILSTKTG